MMTSRPDAKLFTPRPPLGIKPRWLWLEERARELVDTIGRGLPDEFTAPAPIEDMQAWVRELDDVLFSLEQARADERERAERHAKSREVKRDRP